MGLQLTNYEVTTWAEVRCLTDCAIQASPGFMFHKGNLSSLKLYGHIWVYVCPSEIWHSSQSFGKITNTFNSVLLQGEQILSELRKTTVITL